MIDQCTPKLFCVTRYIIGEVKNNGHPDFIRSYFDVSVIDVGIVEGIEKSIITPNHSWTIFFVIMYLLYQTGLPKSRTDKRMLRVIGNPGLKFLYGYYFESVVAGVRL